MRRRHSEHAAQRQAYRKDYRELPFDPDDPTALVDEDSRLPFVLKRLSRVRYPGYGATWGNANAISSGTSPPMVSAMYCLPSCR